MEKVQRTVIMKLHTASGQTVLAVCDPELLGRSFVWGEVEVLISSGFFGGEEVTTEVMIRTAFQCASINAFGKVAIEALIQAGIVTVDAIVYMDDIPHCQVYSV